MRAFWIVLDSAGIGNAPDAEAFGDEGSNTWKTCYDSGKLHIPNMEKLGIYNIDEMNYEDKSLSPIGCYGRLHEKSMGKDTTIGHWEMAGHRWWRWDLPPLSISVWICCLSWYSIGEFPEQQ